MTHDLYYAALGALVAYHRKRRGLTQAELAKQLRLSQPTIMRVEAGRRRVPVLTMHELAWLANRAGPGQLHDHVMRVGKLIEQAAEAIRPGSLEQVPLHGLATFVVAVTESTPERRQRTSRRPRREPEPRAPHRV